MDWQDFLSAFCLMLIFEGMMPFLFPERWQNYLKQIVAMDVTSVRRLGLVCMVLGCLSLISVR